MQDRDGHWGKIWENKYRYFRASFNAKIKEKKLFLFFSHKKRNNSILGCNIRKTGLKHLEFDFPKLKTFKMKLTSQSKPMPHGNLFR